LKKAIIYFLFFPQLLFAQKWVDTAYEIAIDTDSVYGTAIDFAGNVETLQLDIAYPINDTPPTCGRPLVVIFYGGAWMAGSKSDAEVQRLMQDFAKRGYVAVAPNYRLGMFQTASDWNCNVSSVFNIEWNCLNAQDSSEWYRAYYRAVQDAKGAIRYMVNRQTTFDINPNNIFTTGFSAGGFTALGAAFLDHPSEWNSFANAMPDASVPNARYDVGCVQKYGWDTSIASMKLSRPSLGSLDGSIAYPASTTFKIKAVGNLFGGMLYNLLDSGSSTTSIYGFHQPNDLIVPYKNEKKVFDGFNACAYTICHIGILNRPYVYSSPTIKDWAVDAGVAMVFDSTKNTTDCLGQINDPSKGGHQLDNWNRTKTMAAYFATKLDTTDCGTLAITAPTPTTIRIYPNPSSSRVNVESNSPIQRIKLIDVTGKTVHIASPDRLSYPLQLDTLPQGMYFLSIYTAGTVHTQKIIKQAL
jgi:hypothetical protein